MSSASISSGWLSSGAFFIRSWYQKSRPSFISSWNGILLLAACHGRPAISATSAPVQQIPCRTIRALPGPEDFAVDRAASPPGRLLVSSRDLRGCKKCPPDGIYSVPLDGSPAPDRPLTLAGRDACSFHPHGIFLAEGERLLYVINHHDEADASPARGCFRQTPNAPPRERSVTSVEIFRVEQNRLVFLQRLADPKVLTNGNDLVAAGGEIWVTAPPSNFKQLWEILTGGKASKVARFACDRGETIPCTGEWKEVTTLGGFANGIAYREDGGTRFLYVASTRNRKIHVYTIDQEGLKQSERAALDLQTHPDNLEWLDESRSTLVVAAHSNLRRFLQASRSPRVPSPSEVWRVPIENGQPKRILADDGSLLSALSTGACVDGNLVLGQVFGPGIWRCSKMCSQGGTPQ